MSKYIRSRNGFTLAEVLVTIAIIAAIAAVLLPVVSNQLRKGDIGRVTSDMTSLRTGVEAFLADVRRVPGEVSHLIEAPTAASSAVDADINGNAYPAGLVSRWSGPYIDKELSGGVIATGFGGTIVPALATVAGAGSVNWVAVQITGLTSEEFLDIDRAIDTDTSSTAGRFRWVTGDTARYLMMPIN